MTAKCSQFEEMTNLDLAFTSGYSLMCMVMPDLVFEEMLAILQCAAMCRRLEKYSQLNL
jgi:hypothetical protein